MELKKKHILEELSIKTSKSKKSNNSKSYVISESQLERLISKLDNVKK
jgi:hypothetical protein